MITAAPIVKPPRQIRVSAWFLTTLFQRVREGQRSLRKGLCQSLFCLPPVQ